MQKKIINLCFLFLVALASLAQTTNPVNGNATDTTKNANIPNPNMAESTAASGDNTLLYVGIGVVALLAIGFFVMKGRKKE